MYVRLYVCTSIGMDVCMHVCYVCMLVLLYDCMSVCWYVGMVSWYVGMLARWYVGMVFQYDGMFVLLYVPNHVVHSCHSQMDLRLPFISFYRYQWHGVR